MGPTTITPNIIEIQNCLPSRRHFKICKNANLINVWQLLQAKHASLHLKTHARPMVLACIHWPGLAAFAESSKFIKTLILTNFHCI